jgi:hypothetical protein
VAGRFSLQLQWQLQWRAEKISAACVGRGVAAGKPATLESRTWQLAPRLLIYGARLVRCYQLGTES